MRLSRTHTKFLSLFVVAFLCLNAGGVLCLAYCGQGMKAQADHCPLMKQGADCPHSEKTTETTNNTSAEGSSVKCCLLPVSVFAVPLEQRAGITVDTVAVVNIDKIALATAALVRSRQISKFYYRPPPNDRRAERVRNQIFRI